MSSHGGGAAADWVVCRIFRRARPAHRARLGDRQEEEEEEEQHAAVESASSTSSCVTDASGTIGQDDDGDEGISGSCSVASSN